MPYFELAAILVFVAKAIAGRDAEFIQDLACAYRAGLFNEPQGKTRHK